MDGPSCDQLVVDFRPGARKQIAMGGLERAGERMGSCSPLQGHALNDSNTSPPGLTSEVFCLLIVPSWRSWLLHTDFLEGVPDTCNWVFPSLSFLLWNRLMVEFTIEDRCEDDEAPERAEHSVRMRPGARVDDGYLLNSLLKRGSPTLLWGQEPNGFFFIVPPSVLPSPSWLTLWSRLQSAACWPGKQPESPASFKMATDSLDLPHRVVTAVQLEEDTQPRRNLPIANSCYYFFLWLINFFFLRESCVVQAGFEPTL